MSINSEKPGMPPRRTAYIRAFLSAFVLMSAGIYLFSSINLDAFAQAIKAIPPKTIALATLAMASSIAISCIRYQLILKTFSVSISWRSAIATNLAGIFGGIMLFQLVGQTLTRASMLRRHGVPFQTVLVSNIYERFIALVWLTALATIGAFIVYGSIAVYWSGEAMNLTKFLIYGPLGVLLALTFGARRILRFMVRRLLLKANLIKLSTNSLLTILMHLSTLVAYVAIVSANASVDPLLLAGASLIVMFSASLPISFAGWGMRELSAVFAFGFIGIDPEIAFATSVVIGLISFVVLLIALFPAILLRDHSATQHDISPSDASTAYASKAGRDLMRILCWVLPLIAATFVMIQIQVPFGKGAINANIGDPIAILGGILFILRYVQQSDRMTAWHLQGTEKFFLAVTALLIVGFGIGAMRFGITDWALINRLVGWLIISAYVCTGALIVTVLGKVGIHSLARCFIAINVIFILMEIAAISGHMGQFFSIPWLNTNAIFGLANNPNSFALACLFSIVLATTLPIFKGRQKELLLPIVLAVLCAGLFLAKSRTGFVTLGCLTAALLAFRYLSPITFLNTACLAIMLIVTPVLTQKISAIDFNFGSEAFLSQQPVDKNISNYIKTIYWTKSSTQDWDAHRWKSIYGGLDLWKESPTFGAGLGAFIASETEKTGTPLVIHSTPVWVLSELGIVGFFVIYGFGAYFVISSLKEARAGPGQASALIGILFVFMLYQLPHDVFYQRTAWLLLGCLLATRVVEIPQQRLGSAVRP